ncbi:MAG TPA: nuclear transport factor 2 family protein [Steroidobacteraceae bacterium]|nr:nuclear transport factor 2 family protein [Steroidobacteraceae bacterium]
MKKDTTTLVVLAFTAIINAGTPQLRAAAVPATEESWFLARTQALYDGVTAGNRAIWRGTLSDDCIITDEDGHVYDKAAFVETVRPLSKGFRGDIRIKHLTVRMLGTAAASVHYWIDEHEDALGDRLHTVYVETDTYRRESGMWKMIAAQVTVVPADLKPVTVDKRGWPALAGSYRLGKGPLGPISHAYLRDGSLYWGGDEQSAKLLIPLSPLVFFVQGSIHTIVFVRNHTGHIAEALELHKYNEIVMQRIGGAG